MLVTVPFTAHFKRMGVNVLLGEGKILEGTDCLSEVALLKEDPHDKCAVPSVM